MSYLFVYTAIMKRFAFLLSVIFVVHQANSQNLGQSSGIQQLHSHLQYQVGISVTNFIKQFVVPNTTAITTVNPYDFNGKVLWFPGEKKGYGLRLGYGYKDARNASFNMLTNQESTNESRTRSLRVGVEMQYIINERWVVYGGLDYINNLDKSLTINTFGGGGGSVFRDVTNESTHQTGYGPVLGIQFNLGKYICLSTEASLYFTDFSGGVVTTTTFPGSPIATQIDRNGRSANIITPSFINLNIKF